MASFFLYIGTAFALIFVIEGLVYTLFPDFIRKMMAMAVMMPVSKLRLFGLAMAISGFSLVWCLHMFSS